MQRKGKGRSQKLEVRLLTVHIHWQHVSLGIVASSFCGSLSSVEQDIQCYYLFFAEFNEEDK